MPTIGCASRWSARARLSNASLYVNGIDPGFSGDTLVHSAASLTTRISSITVQEIFDYGNYDDAEFTGAAMGFGTTPDDDSPMMFLPGVIVAMWGGQVRSLADHLGITLDDVRQRCEPWYTPERIECTMMTVQPGQMAAVRFATEGVRDGKPVITLEHVTRLTRPPRPTGNCRPMATPVCTASSWRASRGWRSTPMYPTPLRFHRCRLHLHRRPGGQRDRLGVPRAPRADRGRGHPIVSDDARIDVERALN